MEYSRYLVIGISIIFMMILVGLLSGCAGKTVYIDRPVEVKVPVKCQVDKPERPDLKKDNNMSEIMLDLKGYILKLEAALDSCR